MVGRGFIYLIQHQGLDIIGCLIWGEWLDIVGGLILGGLDLVGGLIWDSLIKGT